jgi:hypothetical protein
MKGKGTEMATKLTTDERNELDAIYAHLDAEWDAAGKTTAPERMPFDREDILEWRKLTAHERLLGLRAYAWASDRIASAGARALQRAA